MGLQPPPLGVAASKTSLALARFSAALSAPSADPLLWSDGYIADLRKAMRGRFSWFRSRRRRAHAAVLLLIRWHEANLWPEPVAPTNHFEYVSVAAAVVGAGGGSDRRLRRPGNPAEVTADGHDWRTCGCSSCVYRAVERRAAVADAADDFYELVDNSGQIVARYPRL